MTFALNSFSRSAGAASSTGTYADVLGKGTTLAVGFRHALCLLIGAVWLAFPPRPFPVLIATVALMVWSAVRLRDRRAGPGWVTADLLVVAAYLAVPANMAASASAIGGTTQLKLAYAMVISFGIEQSVRRSAASLAVVLVALFVGFRNVPGLDVGTFMGTFNVQYLFVLWAMSVGARQVVLRAANGVDVLREALARTQMLATVSGARRRYEREQMALMHDTAACTLLMVSTGGVADERALAAQARRDLAALEAGVPVFDDSADDGVDLVVLLAGIASDCRTPLTLVGLGSLRVRQAVAWAVTSAVREALTNVDRHARARSVVVEIRDHSVLVIDDGIGLGRREAGAGRHGIRRSIVGRMHGVGGSASVTGVLGGGTRVELTWTSSSGAGEADEGTGTSRIASGIERLELKLALVLGGIAIVDVVMQSSRVWSEPAPTPPVWAHVALTAVVVACALTAMFAARRRRRTTVGLMVVAVSVSVLLCLLLPTKEMLGVENWSVGAAGWTIIALGSREPRSVTMTALGGWWLLVCATTLTRAPNADTVALLGHVTSTILGVQVLIMLLVATVHQIALVAAERDRERRTIELAMAVDRVLKQECQRRYRDQLRSVVPILRGLAEGTMSPKSPTVVGVARVEYGRLRRLFDHADRMDHWLLADLSAEMDDAEARDVRVTAEAASGLPNISDEARAYVRAAVAPLLATSATKARIVLTTESGQLVVSVVCDATEVPLRENELGGGVESELVVDEESETVWLRLRCPSTDVEGARR
ncbi:hypothetical protein GCM10022247_68530 [Allokutzneria multivorans]|uniref:Signal transduction histidine kinase n=1 Tax=Allokutzneria multivorans TaxID=1142134 RepID=A0ABP7U060_9PSEU